MEIVLGEQWVYELKAKCCVCVHIFPNTYFYGIKINGFLSGSQRDSCLYYLNIKMSEGADVKEGNTGESW